MGDSRAKSAGQLLFECPLSAGKMMDFDFKILTPGRFSVAKGGAKSKVLTSSLQQGGGAHSRTRKAEKS